MKESRFWQLIKPQFNLCDPQRIEVTSGRGVPDVNLIINGVEVWLELKVAYKSQFFLRKEQYVWGCRRAKRGGRVFVLGYAPETATTFIWRYPFDVIHGGKYLIMRTSSVMTTARDKRNILEELISLL